MKKTQNLAQNYLLLIFGILAVSTAAILIRFAMEEVDALVIAAYRMTFSAAISFIVWGLSKQGFKLPINKKDFFLILLAGVLLALHFASWISSLQMVSVSSSVILVTTTPLWVALVSPLVLKESVTKQFYFGLALAVAGGIIIALNGSCSLTAGRFSCVLTRLAEGSNTNLGLFLALFGAWMASGYMLIGRKLNQRIPTMPYTTLVYSIAALVLDLAVILTGDKFVGFSPRAFLFLVLMALIPQAVGHTILNHSLHSLPATTVSLALLGEPIGSTLLAVLLLKETPSTLEVVGGAIILIGIFLAVIPRKLSAVSRNLPFPD